MLKVQVHARFVVDILTQTLPVEVHAGVVVHVPLDESGFRLWLRAVSHIAAFKVRIEAPGKAHVGAIVLRLAIAVEAIIEMTAIAVVTEVVGETIAGAIVAARLPRPEWIRCGRSKADKTSIRRSRPVGIERWFGKATA